MFCPEFEYKAPQTTEELTSLLSQYGERARVMAGGTDLVLSMKRKEIRPDYVIDISRIDDLKGIEWADDGRLVIKARTAMQSVEESEVVKKHYYALYQAVSSVGSPQVRAMASIGGNSCTASPSADSPPALLSFGAAVKLVGANKEREMPLKDFIRGNRLTGLDKDEFLSAILLEKPRENTASHYLHMGLRKAMECKFVNVAVNLSLDDALEKVENVRIAMGAVAEKPIRVREAEDYLKKKPVSDNDLTEAGRICSEHARPIDDFRASADYRRKIVKVLVKRALNSAVASIRQ